MQIMNPRVHTPIPPHTHPNSVYLCKKHRIEIQRDSKASIVHSRGRAVVVVSAVAVELRVGMGVMWVEMKEMQRVQSVERESKGRETLTECTGSEEVGR